MSDHFAGLRVLTFAAVLGVTLSGCATIESAITFGAQARLGPPVLLDPSEAVTASCEGFLAPDATGALPEVFPPLVGSTPLRKGLDNGRIVYTAFLAGAAERVNPLRDLLVERLRVQGYVVGSDRPGRNVATATFSGASSGSLSVQPLCRNLLAVRFTVDKIDFSPPELLAPEKAASTSCQGRLVAVPGGEVPFNLPVPSGATTLRAGLRADAPVFTAFIKGPPANAVTVRNGLIPTLRARGYVVGVEPAERFSAVASFAGPHVGSLLVQPLCRGYLAVRYEIRDAMSREVGLPSPEEAMRRNCDGVLLNDNSGAFPPALAQVAGLSSLPRGRTQLQDVYTGFLRANPGRVRSVRDGMVAELRRIGFVVGADPVADNFASASFAGTQAGRVIVQPLCRGYLAVRYLVNRDLESPQAGAVASCADRVVRRAGTPLAPELPRVHGLTVLDVRKDGAGATWKLTLRGRFNDVADVGARSLEKFRERGGYQLARQVQPAGQTSFTFVRGNRSGSVLVKPLCDGYLSLTYRYEP